MLFDQNYRAVKRNKILLNSISLPKSGSLLDVSCGEGTLLKDVQKVEPNLSLHGIDISAAVIAKAKAANPQINLQQSDAINIPYSDNYFDVVTCSMTLHHYQNLNAVLQEISRVLTINGSVYLMDIFPKNKVSQAVYNIFGCHEPYHFERFYTEEELKTIARAKGLRLTQTFNGTAFPRLRVLQLKLKININK